MDLKVINDLTDCFFDMVDTNCKWDFVLSDFCLIFRRQLIKSDLLVNTCFIILSHGLDQ